MYSHIEGNIYSIFVNLPDNPLKNLNAYLIKSAERNLLIDTGFRREECRTSLLLGLAELGVSMENTDIFLTHLHADHSGLAPDIAGADTKIFMSAEDARRLIASSRGDGWQSMNRIYIENGFSAYEMMLAHGSPMRQYCCRPYEDFVPVENGGLFSYGGHTLRAVSTPGHTPGHMCLYDEAEEILFLGDHVLFDITPNITSWPDFADPLGTYIKSLTDIRDYRVRLSLPAHRGVSGSMSERIDAIIEHHGRRLKEMLDALDRLPGCTAYELAGKISWNIRARSADWKDFPLAQKWFAVGETTAHLDYLLLRGQIRKERRDGVSRYFPG